MGKDQPDKYVVEYLGQQLECDRVTTVLGNTKSSAGLAYWYGKEERKGFLNFLEKVHPELSASHIYGKALNEFPLDNDDDLFGSRARDSKAGSGTGIHRLIEIDAKGIKLGEDEYVTQDDWRRFMFWKDFQTKEGITYVDAERRVYSPNLLVAGTLDLTFNWRDTFWMGDTKTGRLRRDAAVQVTIYYLLREETLAIERKDTKQIQYFRECYTNGVLPMIEWPRMCVLAVGDDKLEVYEIDNRLCDLLARNFLYRLQTYRDDQTLRPFKRIHPIKTLKDGTIKESIWLRAS